LEAFAKYVWRRWWVILLAGVLGGLLGFVTTLLSGDAYTAQSIVVLTNGQIPSDQFADVAKAIFPTDAVLGPVVSELGIESPPRALVSSGALTVVPSPGGQAVQIVARTQDSETSVALANSAANHLAEVGRENGLGTIAAFTTAGPARRQQDPVVRFATAGALAGVVTALFVLGFVYLRRTGSLLSTTGLGPDLAVRIRVEPGATDGSDPRPIGFLPERALASLMRAIRMPGEGPVMGIVIDEGRDVWATLAVAEQVAELAEDGSARRDAGFVWWRASEPPPELVEARSVTVIASEHTSQARLKDVRTELVDLGDPLVVLVSVSAPDLAS
jgi:capsular polysaccharide biosynthesis protein